MSTTRAGRESTRHAAYGWTQAAIVRPTNTAGPRVVVITGGGVGKMGSSVSGRKSGDYRAEGATAADLFLAPPRPGWTRALGHVESGEYPERLDRLH